MLDLGIVKGEEWSHAIVSLRGESTDICILIPQNVQTSTWGKCNSIKNLSRMGLHDKLDIEVCKTL